MNHDLVAAGHPRLNFEYASYLAAYPKHWKEPHERIGIPERRPGRLRGEVVGGRPGGRRSGRARAPGRPGARVEGRGVGESPRRPRPSGPSSPSTNASPATTTSSTRALASLRATPSAGSPGRPGLSRCSPTWRREIQAKSLDAIDKVRVEMARSSPDPDVVAGLALQGVKRLDELIRGDRGRADRTGAGRVVAEGDGLEAARRLHELGPGRPALPGPGGDGEGLERDGPGDRLRGPQRACWASRRRSTSRRSMTARGASRPSASRP